MDLERCLSLVAQKDRQSDRQPVSGRSQYFIDLCANTPPDLVSCLPACGIGEPYQVTPDVRSVVGRDLRGPFHLSTFTQQPNPAPQPTTIYLLVFLPRRYIDNLRESNTYYHYSAVATWRSLSA